MATTLPKDKLSPGRVQTKLLIKRDQISPPPHAKPANNEPRDKINIRLPEIVNLANATNTNLPTSPIPGTRPQCPLPPHSP